ncbi:hypothetical protein HW115_10000 [Verrucomicrobiaceae bacterium N1E253]|uniref:Tetratricopeptide repeat protein n=1 Tax=Oceaniferula marina TaxID=2748318 RepID=A0A851GL95_9BACT|nr:hypothetical protein [Oceaniferula marina]NWK55945.1 hypothetical protein [Oceaniferula marina]
MGPIKPTSVFLVLALCASLVHAHESPEHTIEAINQHAQLTPAQLHQRAIAKRALNQHSSAITDLTTAIQAAPDQLGFRLELARTQLEAGHNRNTLHTLAQALPLATTPEQQAEIHQLRAEAYQALNQHQQALKSIQQAFQLIPSGEIDWYLLRAHSQGHLGQHQQRIDDLASGLKHHPSAVVKNHWIDALIDAGSFHSALVEINRELEDRRWTSSYLIKRARSLQGLNRTQEATADLKTALAEITARLNPQRPDLLLLADQAVAYSLLGEQDQSARSIQQLHAHHAPRWIISRASRHIPNK